MSLRFRAVLLETGLTNNSPAPHFSYNSLVVLGLLFSLLDEPSKCMWTYFMAGGTERI